MSSSPKLKSANSDPVAMFKPSLKDRRRELRHAAIVSAAKEMLRSKGYSAMTLEDVTAAVGISKPTLYQHFASKEELAVHVLVEAMENAENQLEKLHATLSPAAALETMIRQAVEEHFGPGIQPHFSGSLPVFNHPLLREAEESLVTALATTIKRAQREASIVSRAPPRLIAQTLLSILKDPVYEGDALRKSLNLAKMKTGVISLLLG